MRIGITGSWKEDNKQNWSLRSDFNTFIQACRQLGKALVDSGVPIVVGSEAPTTADPYIVETYLAGPWVPESIRIIRPADGKIPFQNHYKQFHGAFRFISGTESSWQFIRRQFIGEIDTVLTIGGGIGTYQAGLATLLAKKRLVPIASFGGASSRLLDNMLISKEFREPEMFKSLNNPWYDGLASHVIDIAKVNQPSRVLLIHGHAQDRKILHEWLQKEKLANPVVMAQEFTAGQTLPEKFESLAADTDAAIALATPDDFASTRNGTDIKRMRARQNVWVETGWFWGRLGRGRVMLLVRGDVEIPSDLDGIVYYSYKKSPLEIENEIRAFLSRVSETNQ